MVVVKAPSAGVGVSGVEGERAGGGYVGVMVGLKGWRLV